MMNQRRRRWYSMKTTLLQRLELAVVDQHDREPRSTQPARYTVPMLVQC